MFKIIDALGTYLNNVYIQIFAIYSFLTTASIIYILGKTNIALHFVIMAMSVLTYAVVMAYIKEYETNRRTSIMRVLWAVICLNMFLTLGVLILANSWRDGMPLLDYLLF